MIPLFYYPFCCYKDMLVYNLYSLNKLDTATLGKGWGGGLSDLVVNPMVLSSAFTVLQPWANRGYLFPSV